MAYSLLFKFLHKFVVPDRLTHQYRIEQGIEFGSRGAGIHTCTLLPSPPPPPPPPPPPTVTHTHTQLTIHTYYPGTYIPMLSMLLDLIIHHLSYLPG